MIAFLVRIIMFLGIIVPSFYVFAKSIQYKAAVSRKVIIIAWCLLCSAGAAYVDVLSLVPLQIIPPVVCLMFVIFAFFITRQPMKTGPRLETVISAYLLAFGVSYALNYVATALAGFAFLFTLGAEHTPGTAIDYNRPVYLLMYTLVLLLQSVLSFLLFRIRRFRKGFPFIFNKFAIVAALFFAGVILILVTGVNTLAETENENYSISIYVIGVLVAGAGIYLLVRRMLKAFQNKRAQQNTAQYYEKKWMEGQADLKLANETIKEQSAIIHNFADRIASMENKALEYGDDAFLADVQKLRKDLQVKMASRKGKQILPTTNNSSIDNLFEHFAKKLASDGIEFKLIVNGSIVYMVENVIPQGALETLILNHLKDAQIAVNASDSPLRRVTAVIGLTDDSYAFTVFDSGISFQAETLAKLGTGRVTTYADSGGSGIGFETTFEIMRETGASLIINEQKQSHTDYSKSVSIRFDGKNQYIIETGRPDAFPPSERYILRSNT